MVECGCGSVRVWVCGWFLCVSVSVCVCACASMCAHMCKHTHLFYSIFVFFHHLFK